MTDRGPAGGDSPRNERPGTGSPENERAESQPPGVELADVSVAFGDVSALENVSITVNDGEFFTLVGPSGCGKTTTLRTIAGFEHPASGTVSIGGASMAGVPPEERDTGIVFQSYALFPHMSVRENVAYGLRFRDPPGGVADSERVEELLDLVDMAGMGERDPDALSGGQQQRVALARALAPGPEVLLLDEPLSALDARLRERLRVTIREIQRDLSITTVYVTHDQAEALAISDRIAVLHEGQIEQIATPEDLYRHPASRFVAEFVGDNNVLDGEVVATDPPRAAVEGSEEVGEGAELALPASASVSRGEAVTVAVRPETIAVEPVGRTGEDTPNATTLDATVTTVEFLGDAYRVHCEWAGRTVLVKTAERVSPGDAVALVIDSEDVGVVQDG